MSYKVKIPRKKNGCYSFINISRLSFILLYLPLIIALWTFLFASVWQTNGNDSGKDCVISRTKPEWTWVYPTWHQSSCKSRWRREGITVLSGYLLVSGGTKEPIEVDELQNQFRSPSKVSARKILIVFSGVGFHLTAKARGNASE